MIHPHTELKFISEEKGYGVVATKAIPKGTITWVQDQLDRVFEPAQVAQMNDFYQDIMKKYCFRNNKGQNVLCWDIARFVNHSFSSNCITTAYDFELAVRDIQPGEELTDDYGFLNLEEPFECLPEPGIERTMVLPDDLLRYHQKWDKKLVSAFDHFDKIDQPLEHLVKKNHLIKIRNIISGSEAMDSILQCYYQANGRSM